MQTETTDQFQVERIEYVSDRPFDDVVTPLETRLGYGRPASLMDRLGNSELSAAARKLDTKLAALAECGTAA
jgi:hypothetical protein